MKNKIPQSTPFKPIIDDDQEMTSRQVGGKFSKQQELRAMGIRTARFFCLTADFYNKVFESISAEVLSRIAGINFSRSRDVQKAAEDIKQFFLTAPVPEDLTKQINISLDSLFTHTGLVSVRASMVGFSEEESEDALDNPFAGISDSFLYVPRKQVIDKIRLCWASGFSSKAMLYRHAQGMDVSRFSVAVGVQAMIHGERSFVMFTCNPQDLSHNAVIISGYGIGEGVVQESVPVDHYFINSQTGEIQRKIAVKDKMIALDEKRGHGLSSLCVVPERREIPCLSDEEIRKILNTGRDIEARFRHPQDIEGTITRDNDIYILQSRPIAIDFSRYRIWSSANVSESFPGCTTPLTYSFANIFYFIINYDAFRRLGIPERDIEDKRESMERILGYIDGRIYHSITNMSNIATLLPLSSGVKNEWERLGVELHAFYYSPKHEKISLAARIKKIYKTTGMITTMARYILALDSRFSSFARWWECLMATRRGSKFHDRHPISLVSDYNEVWKQVTNWWGLTIINWMFMIGLQSEIEKRLKKWGLDDDGSLLSNLLCGDLQLKGVEIVLSVVRLADMVREDPRLKNEFTGKSAEELWKAIEMAELDAQFIEKTLEHIDKYGDRGLQELKLEQPNLRDTPHELVRMIQNYVHRDFTAKSLYDIELNNRAHGEKRLASALRLHPLKKAYIRTCLKLLRKVLHYREEGRYMRSELFGYSKNIFKAIGRHLAQTGVLRKEADIFYLHVNEIFGYIDGSGVTRNLQALTDLRRQEMEGYEKRRPEKEFTTSDIVTDNIPQEILQTDLDQSAIRGIGSSAGKVRGYAKILENPSLECSLGEDAILVARETDPGWLFLMLAAKGIIVERGSMLSHTAITGRKFGIPTVVAVPHATRIIADGSLVEIDGATGTVKILDGTGPKQH